MKNYQVVFNILVKINFYIILLTPSFSWAQHFTGTMNSFHVYDHDKDGIAEINNLKYLSFDAGSESPSKDNELVIVLVENRLFKEVSGSKYSRADLINQLKKYKEDLKKDGLDSRFVISDIYKGNEHQDGLTVLALREWFREVYKHWNLKGVVLVGNFPDAMLVRRWIWRKNKKDIEINGKMQKGVNYLRIYPEYISDRSDIVLADLDGKWDEIYVKKNTELEYIEALPDGGLNNSWPNNEDIFTTSSFNQGYMKFEDFFWIKDDNYTKLPQYSTLTNLSIKLKTELRNPEISESDKSNPNPIAIPEILVSRINPYNIAVQFDDPYATGPNFLDANGKSQVYETTRKLEKADYIKRDNIIERKLLIEYFKRNHDFRSGEYTSSYQNVASISYGLGLDSAPDVLDYLKKAIQNPQHSYIRQAGSLLDYITFLQYEATLKGAVAHSNSTISQFGKVDDLKYLYKQLGNHIYRWKRTFDGAKYKYTPTLEDHNGLVDAYFNRSIYENGILSNSNPNFFIHMGCQVNSPQIYKDRPYSDIAYSNRTGEQNSESILFFTNDLAIASRAKVFNDCPNGFTDELGSSNDKRFGDGLIAYHTKESQNPVLADQHAQCKRPYTWSIQGDATLKLRYEWVKGE